MDLSSDIDDPWSLFDEKQLQYYDQITPVNTNLKPISKKQTK